MARTGRPRRDRAGERRRAEEALSAFQSKGPSLAQRQYTQRERAAMLAAYGSTHDSLVEVMDATNF